MITQYKAADPLDPTSQAEYKLLAGGATRTWVGTEDAYNAEKNNIPNNTMICITDDDMDVVVDVYSTNETKTNKVWIDGKPIYRKAGFKSGNVSGVVIDSTLTWNYIQNIVSVGGSVFIFDAMASIGGYTDDTTARATLTVKNNGLIFGNSPAGTPHDLYWWIEYTKKTN